MKRIVFISVLVFACSLITAQDTTAQKNKGNFEASLGFKVMWYPSIIPALGYSFGKHNVALGYVTRKFYNNLSNSSNFFGFNLSYNFFPNDRHNRFNLHFLYNSQFLYFESRESFNMGMMQQKTFLVNHYILEQSLGFGFHFTHAKKSFFRLETGFGLLNVFKRVDGYGNLNSVEPSVHILLGWGIRFLK